MEQAFTAGAIGLLVAIATEIVKFIPWFIQKTNRMRVLAIILSIVGVVLYGWYQKLFQANFTDITILIGVFSLIVGTSYAVYQAIIKTITPIDTSKAK